MGGAEGGGGSLQDSRLQGFDTLVLHQVSEIDVGMSPLYASALFLEHDTPVAVQGSLNSPIRDKPMSP